MEAEPEPVPPAGRPGSGLYIAALGGYSLLTIIYLWYAISTHSSVVPVLQCFAACVVMVLAARLGGVFVVLLGIVSGLSALGMLVVALDWQTLSRGAPPRIALMYLNVVAGLLQIALTIQLLRKLPRKAPPGMGT